MTGAHPGTTWIARAASCTLPTADKPLRLAEFDELFASSTLAVQRKSKTRASLTLRPDADVAAMAAELSVRETECCSFFEFALIVTGGSLTMDVSVPDDRRVPVLDALVDRAATASRRES